MPDLIDPIERKIPLGDFNRIVVDETRRLLVEAKRSREIATGGGFVRRDPTVILSRSTIDETLADIAAFGVVAVQEFPELADLVERAKVLATKARNATSGQEALEIYSQLMAAFGAPGDGESGDNFSLKAEDDAIFISANEIGYDPHVFSREAMQNARDDQAFLAATGNFIAQARQAGRSFTRDEQGAIAASYRLLERGVQLPPSYQGIGVYGFRKHQTSLSLANPGEGHVTVTCTDARLLEGTVIHIEHIDRDNETNREIMEPYRLPAAINAARVRLHVGAAVPCTAYIGRPVFENGAHEHGGALVAALFERDLLKSAHLSASAATAMFSNGVADCKFGIERMTSRQAIKFMRALAGNVMRDSTIQYLSAAFNIRIPFLNDLDGAPVVVIDRFAIAKLGIDIAVQGRFEKVTWDGASNQSPSIPIIEQLPLPQWVDLVHEAHERGLETYISAGLKPPHMRECVYLGVDGVGIGTSLHHFDAATGTYGQLQPDKVLEVLNVRNAAASEPLGKGARLLARLDRLFFEGTLPEKDDAKRVELYKTLRAHDPEAMERLLSETGHEEIVQTDEHPVLGHARRVVRSANMTPIGAARMGAARWGNYVQEINKLLKAGDITALKQTL